MAELPCRTILQSKSLSVILLTATLFSAGCAQLPQVSDSSSRTQSAAVPAVEWPTPTLADTVAPTPPEPTILPRAERPADKTPEILRAPRRAASGASSRTTDAALPQDAWQRIRNGFQMAPLDSALVSDWETYYASRPEYFAKIIENSRPFLYHVITEVERRGMPAEIALLPIIESAYNPVAYSSAHASGIWQFIPSTGKNYGLKQNSWYDGRRDVIAATGAALDYLQNLHGMFKDWELALASYNWGEGAVQRAVDRNQAKGLSANYTSLTNMPAETRNYLPKLMAVKNIIADPARFGVTLASVPNESYLEVITMKRHIDVAVAAKFAEMSTDEFRFLNPAHSKPVINSNSTETILLPKDKVTVFMANLSQNQDKPLASLKTHTVRAGERPETIAAEYGISVTELNQVNNIGGRRRIVTGQTILVPAGGELQPMLSEVSAPAFIPVAVARGPQRTVARGAAGRKAAAPAMRTRVATRVPARPAAVVKHPVGKPIARTASR